MEHGTTTTPSGKEPVPDTTTTPTRNTPTNTAKQLIQQMILEEQEESSSSSTCFDNANLVMVEQPDPDGTKPAKEDNEETEAYNNNNDDNTLVPPDKQQQQEEPTSAEPVPGEPVVQDTFVEGTINPNDDATNNNNTMSQESPNAGSSSNDTLSPAPVAALPLRPAVPVKFCKLQEPGSHDPPRFRLVPWSAFQVVEEDPTTTSETTTTTPNVSLDLLLEHVSNQFAHLCGPNTDTTTTVVSWSLQYRDRRGDVIALSSSAILGKALEEWDQDLCILVRPAPRIQPWPTSIRIHLMATWEDKLETSFSSCRLIEKTVEQPPRFSHLKAIASNQFTLPVHCLSFVLVPSDNKDDKSNGGSAKQRPHRITCDEDLADALFACANNHQDVLPIQVELVLATVTRICYPTVDNDTMSRRIPLKSLVGKNGKLRYEKILETVADSLDTEEFVLTYSMKSQTISSNHNDTEKEDPTDSNDTELVKYFITCPEDLLDAMRQFPGGELVLVPQVPQQTALGNMEDDGEQQDKVPATPAEPPLVVRRSKLEAESPQEEDSEGGLLRLSYQGRDGASVSLPVTAILDERGEASYWNLVGLVIKSFHLGLATNGTPPPICLFYVHPADGSRAEITSNAYLNEIMIQRDSAGGSKKEHSILVEPVAFSLTTFSSVVALRRFSLSHVMYNDGSGVSFMKLVRLARLTDPVVGLSCYDMSRNKTSIGNDKDFAQALHEFPGGDIVIRPQIQQNPYVLQVRDALLTGKKCKLGSWATPNIMIKSDSAMACWDLSEMLQGRYSVSARYWRDAYKGPVNVRIGVVAGTDMKKVTRKLAADQEYTSKTLNVIRLESTGITEADFAKATRFGEFNVRSNSTKDAETSFLVVAASLPTPKDEQLEGYCDIFVSNMELSYLGPVETASI